MNRARKAAQAAQYVTDNLGAADDVIQDLIRSKILGVKPGVFGNVSPMPEKGPFKAARRGLANTVFAPRGNNQYDFTTPFENNRAGVAAMLATRGIQAGGLTAAGLGLAQLTNAFGQQNLANQQTDTQLRM